MKITLNSIIAVLVLWMSCCASNATDDLEKESENQEIPGPTENTASVTEVTVSGEENQYTFSVTISSPDLGCQQYANWWEVIDMNGNLLYRRILAHSHVDEQPFTRTGGPVDIDAVTEVYVRAHMNTSGYGNIIFKGSVANGFASTKLNSDFAINLEKSNPLPENCAF